MQPASDGLLPDWPAPPGVRALFTTRAGGVSSSPFDSFNLGDHVKDEPLAVAVNRERLAAFLAPARPVFLRQVHGTAVVRLSPDTPDGTEADGCVAVGPGAAATIMVADCLPVLLAHASGTAVAAPLLRRPPARNPPCEHALSSLPSSLPPLPPLPPSLPLSLSGHQTFFISPRHSLSRSGRVALQ